ncbi:MAG: sigma-70 family RNA polymerase sigma factor [Candidatus Nealsonbacteria bacterium]|nr:sigma-70 family RNA polymerase sigma factor [Candidatus Nealsonbacteria bacterium]
MPDEEKLPPPDQPDICDLIRRAREGDDEARERLFELCRKDIGHIARSQVETWLRVKVDASDLIQQTMLEAHRDFDRFQGGSEKEWRAWLRKILSHNAADFVRRYRGTAKRQARREVRFRDPADSRAGGAPEPAAPGATPSQEFLQIDDEARMTAALTELSPDHRRVIELRNLQRLPFNEVAEQMDRSRPAVQMLWMRAIKKLQEAMGGEGEGVKNEE